MSGDWHALPPDDDPRIVPDPDGLAVDFYAHVARGELRFQRCGECGTFRHPPRYRCAACGSGRFDWALSSGRGRLFSWTVSHRPADPGWARIALPYATLVVEMEEGVRVVGALLELPLDALRLDLPLAVEIERRSDTFGFLWFRPA